MKKLSDYQLKCLDEILIMQESNCHIGLWTKFGIKTGVLAPDEVRPFIKRLNRLLAGKQSKKPFPWAKVFNHYYSAN